VISLNTNGTDRRVLTNIAHYPQPNELKKAISEYQGTYKTRIDFYQKRDKALAAILFLAQLRKSEAHRLIKSQFQDKPFRITKVKLSKAEKRNKKSGKVIVRKDQYRKEILLPSRGVLGELSAYIKDYLDCLKDEDRLFPFSDKAGRTNQIIKEIFSDQFPPHWLRAFGENHLYELFDYDLIGVANYVQVDSGTLSKYIHRTPEKYLKKLR
jgi:integrase